VACLFVNAYYYYISQRVLHYIACKGEALKSITPHAQCTLVPRYPAKAEPTSCVSSEGKQLLQSSPGKPWYTAMMHQTMRQYHLLRPEGTTHSTAEWHLATLQYLIVV
jgi:hypothetical protein